MTYDSEKHHRRSIRLKGFDYSQAGAYYITVCAQDRACLFGDSVGNQIQLNAAGRMLLAEWDALPDRFPGVELDAFVVMPNHVHGIFVITTGRRATTRVAPTGDSARDGRSAAVEAMVCTGTADSVGAGLVPALSPAVGDIVGAFKSLTTVSYGRGVKAFGWPTYRRKLWQWNFYEHVIRDDDSWNRIRQYILDNPANWATDAENPQAEAPNGRTMHLPSVDEAAR